VICEQAGGKLSFTIVYLVSTKEVEEEKAENE
jgi:hypothetical protein